MDTYADASIIASSPGRLRIGIAGLYRNPALKRRLEAHCAGHEAVTAAVANPLTGRLLVLFRPATSPDTLLQQLGIATARPPAPGAAVPAEHGNRGAPYPPWHLRGAGEALAFHASSERSGLSRAEAEPRRDTVSGVFLTWRERRRSRLTRRKSAGI